MLLKIYIFAGLMIGLRWATSCPPNYQYESGLNQPQGACIGPASTEKQTLDANEKICQSNGGHLIKITNSFENIVVQAYLQQLFPQSSVAQIGLRRNGSTWLWTDGSTMTYTNWGQNFVDDCVYMDIRQGAAPYWFPYPCEQKLFGLCQNPVSACSSGWTYFQPTGKCYYYGRNATLDQAKQYCASELGQLASIHSDAENSFVQDLIATDSCRRSYYGSSFYGSHVILGGELYSQSNGTWWDNSKLDYIPASACFGGSSSVTPIIYMDGAPWVCDSCDVGGWSSSSYNLTTDFVFPGYLCKAPPLPTVQRFQPSDLIDSNHLPTDIKI